MVGVRVREEDFVDDELLLDDCIEEGSWLVSTIDDPAA